MNTALAIFLCLHFCTGATSAGERRSDDASFQVLESVIEQQTASLQQQAVQLQALQHRLAHVESALTSATTELQALKNSPSSQKQVAFSAVFRENQGAINIGSSGPIGFNNIVTNVGHAYHHNGYFIAPYAGVYAFFLSITSSNVHSSISVGIYRNSTLLTLARGDGIADLHDKSSAFVTTHLNKGQQVYAQHSSGGTYLAPNMLTTFSGFLVSAD